MDTGKNNSKRARNTQEPAASTSKKTKTPKASPKAKSPIVIFSKPKPVEKPMTHDAWCQTDDQLLESMSNNSVQKTDPKLIEVIENLQKQIALQTEMLQNLQAKEDANENTATSSNYRILANGVLEPVEIDISDSGILNSEGSVKEESICSQSDSVLSPKEEQSTPKIWNFRKATSTLEIPTSRAHIITSPDTSTRSLIDVNDIQPNSGNTHVSIGPNNTKVQAKLFDAINWNNPSIATRRLLSYVFNRDTLATHTMTGKPSPAFKGSAKPQKEMLNQKKVADIIFAVTRKTAASEKEVRNVITTKCADENKMLRQREKMRLLKLGLLTESNKENIIII